MLYFVTWLITSGLVIWQAASVLDLFFGILLATVLVIALKTDITSRIIPDKLLVWGGAACLLIILIGDISQLLDHLLGAIITGGILFFIAMFSDVGGGDIKLLAFVGLVLGVEGGILALLLMSICGMLYTAYRAFNKQLQWRSMIPFAPLITLGSMLSYFVI